LYVLCVRTVNFEMSPERLIIVCNVCVLL